MLENPNSEVKTRYCWATMYLFQNPRSEMKDYLAKTTQMKRETRMYFEKNSILDFDDESKQSVEQLVAVKTSS